MNRCPISYEIIYEGEHYSLKGLHSLSAQLKSLNPLELSAEEQRNEALERVGKMSIQGVQKKLSAQLKVKAGCFEIVDQKGHYILKPQSETYLELPENEAITMTLAKTIGLEVPVHGLVYSKDKSFTYFIKRFDRKGHNKKIAVEDFAQLSGESRHRKYQSSMEKVIAVIERFCTFPRVEFVKLFKLTVFNYLVGNEDMHLKNFSLISIDKKTTLSPVYDLLNSTIALKNAKEEIALPIRDRKNNLTKQDFINYLAVQKLQLNSKIIGAILQEFTLVIPFWHQLISSSFLSIPMQQKYLDLLDERSKKLDLHTD